VLESDCRQHEGFGQNTIVFRSYNSWCFSKLTLVVDKKTIRLDAVSVEFMSNVVPCRYPGWNVILDGM
jgi:hypothetical protein